MVMIYRRLNQLLILKFHFYVLTFSRSCYNRVVIMFLSNAQLEIMQ